ncbi:MAG: MBL fold metallo-hydrolase [Thermoleophilia bacterium]|nr:MBL fold metallo-hydrolase [Thermoleophilia bacterium]
MKTARISPGTLQLTRFGAVNAFLVREDDGFTLIDAMVKGSEKGLAAAAADAGAPINRIVITHAHSDHYGSLVALAKLQPEAELIASTRDARLMNGDKTPEPGEPEGKLRVPFPDLGVSFDRLVDEGDRIASLEVVATPGHSPGQIALLDTRDSGLVVADAYSSLGGLATTAGPYWKFPLPGFVTWHRPSALESAKKLRALDPAWLAVGHGKPIADPASQMDKAIARSS